VDPENGKALYRRAVANRQLENFFAAKRDIEAALILKPNDICLLKEKKELHRATTAIDNREKGQYQGMFEKKSFYE